MNSEKTVLKKISDYTKLFFAGIVLVWAYLHSPFNSLYNEFDPKDMYFVKLSFAYWSAVSVYLLIIIFFINKNNYQKYLSKIFTFGALFYYLFLIPFGFDVTYTGIHLSGKMPVIYRIWHLIQGIPLLLWARAGFVLVQVGISYFSYKIMLLYFKPLRVFVLISVLTVSFSFWQYYFTVNYDNFSLLLLLVSSFLLLKSIRKSKKNISPVYILSVIFFAAGLLCKTSGISVPGVLFYELRTSIAGVTNSFVNIFLTLLLFSFASSRIDKNRALKLIYFSAAGWFLYYMIFDPHPAMGIISFSMSLYLIWIICISKKELEEKKELALISVAIFILSLAGSEPGIPSAIRTGSAVLLLSSALLLISSSEAQTSKIKLPFNFLYPLSILLFAIFYIQDDFRPYQDFSYKFMTHSFKSPQLLGIKSNKDRVEVVDSLLTYLNDIFDLKDQDIYFAKHSPMYYYLTGTKYRLDSPWDTLNKLEDIKADFERQAPEMIVLPKGSHRNYMWPNENKRWENDGGEIKAKPYYDFYDDFIEENDYIVTYENSFYTVYTLRKEEKYHEQIGK